MSSRVLLIHTGGTLGMTSTHQGLENQPGHLEKRLEKALSPYQDKLPSYDFLEFEKLIDSSNTNPGFWTNITKAIEKHYENYAGFVVIHGTDTLAYTASALSFTLKNLSKPVILTGAQIPLESPRSDGLDHIITSLIFASTLPIYEVAVYFHASLYRGNRVQKINADGFDAFASPNCERLARVGTRISLNKRILLTKPAANFSAASIQPASILHWPLFPGHDTAHLKKLLDTTPQALILQSYGSGNFPQDDAFIKVLKQAAAQNILLVNKTQCQIGHVQQDIYATNAGLRDLPILSAHDMTFESIITKLMWLLSQNQADENICHEFQTNVAGEMTL